MSGNSGKARLYFLRDVSNCSRLKERDASRRARPLNIAQHWSPRPLALPALTNSEIWIPALMLHKIKLTKILPCSRIYHISVSAEGAFGR